MFTLFRRKGFYILQVILLIAVLLTGCKQWGSSQDSNQKTSEKAGTVPAASVSSAESGSPAPVSRLSEILDNGKYANQFKIWMFNIEYKDSSGKLSAGDTMLLQAPDGTTMLIDAGYKETIKAVLQNIKKLGISKLDYVVATHMHPDHVGGFPLVINTLPIGKVLASKHTDFDFVNSTAFLNVLKEKNMKIDTIKEGDTFQFGKDIKVEVLSPDDSENVVFNGDGYSNQQLVNEQSVVLKMSYGNNRFLFPGDIQIETEIRLVEKYGEKLDVDLLKAPHHGYATSSSNAFLKALSPAITLIPNCGIGNLDVYNRYKGAGSKAYVTGLDGMLLTVSDGKNITIITEKDRKPGSLKP